MGLIKHGWGCLLVIPWPCYIKEQLHNSLQYEGDRACAGCFCFAGSVQEPQ